MTGPIYILLRHVALQNNIVVIEEFEADACELKQKLAAQGIENPTTVFASTSDAKTYFRNATKAAGALNSIPAAVILSLGIEPRVGFEFVRWLRQDRELNSLVVITLGSAGHLREVQEAYASGANAYFIKSADSGALIRTLKSAFGEHQTHPAFRNSTDLYGGPRCADSKAMAKRGPFLLVEGDDTHAKQFAITLELLKIRNPLRRTPNVDEAISYLAGAGTYADREANPAPIVLFLDIRMPDSHRLLAWMEGHPEARPLGIIALTTSHDMRPVIQAYHLGVHSFLKEPPKLEELRNALNAIPKAVLCSEETGYWVQARPAA